MKKEILTFILLLTLAMSIAGCGGSRGEKGPAPSSEGGADYTIKVKDQKGDPVAGAVVNICTDTTCEPRTTDGNGVICYSGDMNNYHLEVIKVPEGYDIGEDADLYTGEETQISLQVMKE